MSERHTTLRVLHDVGLAAWFGGSLFGVAGLNTAAAEAGDRRSARRVASIGWAKWTPVNAVAIGTHLVGAVGLLAANRDRVARHPGAARNAAVKTTVTAAALGASAYARLLGKRIEQSEIHRRSDVRSSTTSPVASPGGPESTAAAADKAAGQAVGAAAEQLPVDVAQAEQQLQYVQFAVPALTGIALALGSQAGEQQRPSQQLREIARRVAS